MLGALEGDDDSGAVRVVGVHSAKFHAEDDPARVREAMRRHDVRHPVVVDRGREIWKRYAIRAWPTLVFVRPDGTIAGVLPGEPDPATVREIVDELVREARAEGTLAVEEAARRTDASGPPPATPLAYPTKVIPLPGVGVVVADTGHDRIVFADERGRIVGTVGSGEAGLEDGDAERARFRAPRGLALDGPLLYVADTGNHALRVVDLARRSVATVAGDGRLGRRLPGDLVPGRTVSLRSPWDLAVARGVVFIAMAGAHQIWAYLPGEDAVGVLAGTGREAIEDGPFDRATFAQPTGLATDGRWLYVADSEASAVRRCDLDGAEVRTLVGKGLFEFGDRDGPADLARLQHVEAVSWGPHGLLVADTYNDKIRAVDAETGTVETWYARRDELGLAEPSGLAQLADGSVVVADTNHHRLVWIDAEGREVRPLLAP